MPSCTTTRGSVRSFQSSWPAPHIHGVHARRSALQQAVGEAARGGADIEADLARDVERKVAQRARQFESAAADIGRAREHLHRAIVVDRLAGLGGLLPVDQHLAGHDQRLRFLAGFGEAALHQQTVEPLSS